MTREEAVALVRSIERRCRGRQKPGVAKVVKALLEEGRAEEAKTADQRGREPCGGDFNEIILANPLDGALRYYTCPDCGATGTYRAPLIEIDAPAG